MLQQFNKFSSPEHQIIPLENFLASSKTGFLIFTGDLECRFFNAVITQMFDNRDQCANPADILQKLEINTQSFQRILRTIINSGVWNRHYDQQGNMLNISIFSLQEKPELIAPVDRKFLLEIRDCTRELSELQQINEQFTLEGEKDRLRAEFFNQISHEFKTPLHAILGFSEHMRAADNLPDEHIGNLDEIINASRTLLGSVNGIIESSHNNEFQLSTKQEHLAIEDLFDECIALFSNMATLKQVKLESDGKGIKVFSDKIRLK